MNTAIESAQLLSKERRFVDRHNNITSFTEVREMLFCSSS